MVAELVYLRIFQSPDWGLGAAISVVLVLFVGVLMALLLPLSSDQAQSDLGERRCRPIVPAPSR